MKWVSVDGGEDENDVYCDNCGESYSICDDYCLECNERVADCTCDEDDEEDEE